MNEFLLPAAKTKLAVGDMHSTGLNAAQDRDSCSFGTLLTVCDPISNVDLDLEIEFGFSAHIHHFANTTFWADFQKRAVHVK